MKKTIGFCIAMLFFVMFITKLTISQPSIPKKTNIPNTTTIKATGLVSAYLDDMFMTRKFSYASKVSFNYRQ